MSLQPEPEYHPVPRSKAPWTLKAESYMLFLNLKELPKGVYDSFEETWADPALGEFKGGLGAVVIIRYTDTPVGPYDELMIIPGNFTIPKPSSDGILKLPKKALRIARIYVSQRTTTYNGRLNWNIPKHLARFSFSAPTTTAGTSPPTTLDVKVFPPGSVEGDGVKPFFACTLQPWRWLPAIPVNTSWVPVNMAQVQPPVPQPKGHEAAVEAIRDGAKIDEYDTNPKYEESLCVGTERWTMYNINGKIPRARGCWVTMGDEPKSHEEREAGERHFPQGLKPWSIGGWMEEGVLNITEPLEWKL